MATNGGEKKKEKGDVLKYEGPMSERFTVAVIKEFRNTTTGTGIVELSPFQKRLAQHLFIKIDTALTEFEKKRSESGKDTLPIIWQNVNMTKLALSAMDRIELGLDALIPNHIWPIPYFNKRLNKYDLDLRVGYVGKDYYVRKMAIEDPVDIRYELVYEEDKFEVFKKSKDNPVESYKFEIKDPFDRGNIVGGFGYISYKDETKNLVVIVTEKDFERSKKKALSEEFWNNYPTEMKLKTLVHRVTSRIKIDPEKVNAAYLRVEAEEDAADAALVQSDIESRANVGPIIEMESEPAEAETEKPKAAEKTGEQDKGQIRQPGF